MPTDQQELAFAELYSTILKNITNGSSVPSSGAIVRESSANLEYDPGGKLNYASFIVDIAELEQSYHIWFEWSDDNQNPNLSGYAIAVTCLSGDDVICPDFACTGMFSEENAKTEAYVTAYPIISDLPIEIDYYENGHGRHIRYSITGNLSLNETDETVFKLIITDYTGENYDSALERIRNLGYDPNDYEIEYLDYSQI